MPNVKTVLGIVALVAISAGGIVLYRNRERISNTLSAGFTNRIVSPIDSWFSDLLDTWEGRFTAAGPTNSPPRSPPVTPTNPRNTDPNYPSYTPLGPRGGSVPTPPIPGNSGQDYSQDEWRNYNEAEINRRKNQGRVPYPTPTPPTPATPSFVPKFIGSNSWLRLGKKSGDGSSFTDLKNEEGWTTLFYTSSTRGSNAARTATIARAKQQTLDKAFEANRAAYDKKYDYFRKISYNLYSSNPTRFLIQAR